MHGESSSPYWGEAVVCGHAAGQVCEHLVLCSQVLIPVFCDKKTPFGKLLLLSGRRERFLQFCCLFCYICLHSSHRDVGAQPSRVSVFAAQLV